MLAKVRMRLLSSLGTGNRCFRMLDTWSSEKKYSKHQIKRQDNIGAEHAEAAS